MRSKRLSSTEKHHDDLVLFESILESASFGVAFFDTKLTCLKINQALATMYGRSHASCLGKSLEKIHKSTGLPLVKSVKKVLRTKKPIFDYELRGFPASTSKKLHHWLVDMLPIFLEKKLIGVAIIYFDITQRRDAEQGLRHQANLLNNVSDAIIATDLKNRITSWNTAAERFYGWKVEEVIGRDISEVIQTRFFNNENKAFREIVLKTGSWQGEIIQRRRNGEPIHIFASVSVIKNSLDEITGLVTVNRDVTEIKQSEEALRFLTDATGVLASSVDYETNLITVADLAIPVFADWCAVHLIEGDGSVSVHTISHVDPDKEKLAYEWAEKYQMRADGWGDVHTVITTGHAQLVSVITPTMIESATLSKNHRQLLKKLGIHSYMCVPIKAEKDMYGSMTFISSESGWRYDNFDLSVAQELANRAALAITNARLFAASLKAIETRDEFISIASHELKTPLTSIKAFVQLLQKRLATSQDQKSKEFIDKVHVQIGKLTQLVSDLLDITKIRSGKLSYRMSSFDLSQLVHQIAQNFQDTVDTHTITMKLVPATITGDPDKITQVLENYLSNAVKYSPQAKQITVAMTVKKKVVRVSVSDEGIGISAEHLPKVFERFFRAGDKEAGTMSSLGLGLYISAEIVRDHGGKVGVKSVKGKGSTFWFEIPL